MTQSNPSSLEVLRESIRVRCQAYYDQLDALQKPADDDLEACVAYAKAIDQIGQSGTEYIQKAQTWLAPWMDKMEPDIDVALRGANLDLEKVHTLIQRLAIWNVQSLLDVLAESIEAGRQLAATYLEGSSLRQKLVYSPAGRENEKPQSAIVPPSQSPNTDKKLVKPQEPHSSLPSDIKELSTSVYVRYLVESVGGTQRRIQHYRGRYRQGRLLDFGMAAACMGIIRPLRRTMELQRELLRNARRDLAMEQSRMAIKRPKPSKAATSQPKRRPVPAGWSIVEPIR